MITSLLRIQGGKSMISNAHMKYVRGSHGKVLQLWIKFGRIWSLLYTPLRYPMTQGSQMLGVPYIHLLPVGRPPFLFAYQPVSYAFPALHWHFFSVLTSSCNLNSTYVLLTREVLATRKQRCSFHCPMLYIYASTRTRSRVPRGTQWTVQYSNYMCNVVLVCYTPRCGEIVCIM